MSAFVIDAFEFCRLKERKTGQIAVSDLPRLAAELVEPAGALHWSLEGGRNNLGHSQLTLRIEGDVKLQCQRCLQPFDFRIASESVLALAKDEASADEIEQLLNDEEVEVIVGSATFDVLALIEDEALLALPLSPKHLVCPDQSLLDAAQSPRKESPFAVLKNLKK